MFFSRNRCILHIQFCNLSFHKVFLRRVSMSIRTDPYWNYFQALQRGSCIGGKSHNRAKISDRSNQYIPEQMDRIYHLGERHLCWFNLDMCSHGHYKVGKAVLQLTQGLIKFLPGSDMCHFHSFRWPKQVTCYICPSRSPRFKPG